jgi:sulfane dehydrogenase subunit SoxC
MRLWLPGYEGNMNVKYVRRIKLTEEPAMSYYESRTYSQILPNEKAYRFYFLQEVKSFITSPVARHEAEDARRSTRSPASPIREPARIRKVLVSADGGQSWGDGGAARSGAAQGVHPVQNGMALEWRPGRAAEPRV